MVVAELLLNRILYLSKFAPVAGHAGQRKMYDTLWHSYRWPHMGSDVYATIAKCEGYIKNGNRLRHRHRMNFFPATGPLGFVAMDTLGPLPEKTIENQYVLAITDRFSKLSRTIPTSEKTSPNIANLLLHHMIIPFCRAAYLLTDNEPQFIRNFLSYIRGYLG